MTFGSNISASNWEPFCRAIERLSKAFANLPDLAIKHKYYIDMLRWDIPFDDVPTPVKTVNCELTPRL